MSEERVPYGHLPEDVLWRLERADGFLDLKLPVRAQAELDGIHNAFRNHTPVMECRLRLAMAQEDWAEAVQYARRLATREEKRPDYFVLLAYATRRAEGIEPAEFILKEAQLRFPEVAAIAFNLACYACQSGRNDQAMEHLHHAFKLDPAYKRLALEDEDLTPLWPVLE
ncbi:MAG TPA: hypothetical protein VIH35_01985 [Kiritimatiellia bacterium]|jgi:tetratricopeptide (TPR) repeat protein